jgi:hypothetical protein
MAIALTGAVIIEQRGSMMNYRKKCEYCGYVEGGGTTTCAPSSGNILTSSFHCQKCQTRNEVRVQG